MRRIVSLAVFAVVVSVSGIWTTAVAQAVPINSPDYVWIYGQRISQTESCWGASARPVLQIKRDGVWTTVAKATMSRSAACKAKYPMRARYTFVLEDLGEKDPTGRTYTLQARTVSGINKYPFTKTVYKSKADHAADLADTFNDMLSGSSGGSPSGSSPSGSSSSSGWSGCNYNGIPMYGNVKVVSYGADVVVHQVSSFADLKVKEVTAFPSSCGEWKFVDFGEDFTVQFSNSGFGVDFDIQFVTSFPGR